MKLNLEIPQANIIFAKELKHKKLDEEIFYKVHWSPEKMG
jgi:hypothetical protein